MADAGEILREAQYELQNVTHGSTDSRKHASAARSLARKVIRKFPDSQEAEMARSILEQLGERVPPPRNIEQQRVSTVPVPEPVSQQRYETSHSQPGDGANRYAMPGWPLRLAQAIPVVVGVLFVLRGFASFAFARPDAISLFFFGAGGLLIYFPRTAVFANIVGFARTKIFVDEDWYAEVDHLPTQQDALELLGALARGSTVRRLTLLIVLFFPLSMTAAVLYVIGVRKAFDAVEGWLLERDDAAASNNESGQ